MSGVSIELRDIVQEFPSPEGEGVNRVIDGISLDMDQAGIHMLLGPSGCGKSTLLYMMGGVRPIGVTSPTSGQVLIDGEECTGPHDDAVMVFQRYSNRPDLSVRRNVALPFRMKLWRKKVPPEECDQRVDAMLEAVGLADKANLRPSQLSGGQNAQTREEMQRLLGELIAQQPCLVVFVTHDVTEALLLGDRVITLSTQPARIADDFEIGESRPRSADWLRTTQAVKLE